MSKHASPTQSSTERPKMTAAEATSFSRVSMASAMMVALAKQDCGCEPYRDVFTYNRWAAQGMQVQRGQHAITLPLVVDRESTDEATGEVNHKRMLGSSHVFCRCQVAAR